MWKNYRMCVCGHRKQSRIIYQIFTAVWRKSPILHACNFQNNLLLACIFCMALKIRSIKNKDGSFSLLSSKMSLPTNISYLKRRMGRPTLQTAWISRLRHHNEGAIFSQGAGPWPSQWKMDSIKACVWSGQYTSLKSNSFLWTFDESGSNFARLTKFGGYLKKASPLDHQTKCLDCFFPKREQRKRKQTNGYNPMYYLVFVLKTFFSILAKEPQA